MGIFIEFESIETRLLWDDSDAIGTTSYKMKKESLKQETPSDGIIPSQSG